MRLIDAHALQNEYKQSHEGKRLLLIDVAPTIEPKKGEWMSDNNNYYEERYVCSACKQRFRVDVCMGKPIWNFCPNCGALMKEGDLE